MKKILKLLIGTNNKGKYKEIKDLLPKYIKTHSVSEFKLKSPREDGSTFEENSIIKSKHFSKKTRLICLADDSGLEIDILNKSPGIYSARWGGRKGDFKKHLESKKHKSPECYINATQYFSYCCPCGKKYKHHSSFYRHRSKCGCVVENEKSSADMVDVVSMLKEVINSKGL